MEKEIKAGDGIIVLKNRTKRFGENLVLDNVSLAFEKGKTTVIIGPSGCGKTVLIKHIIVLLRPSEGEIYFNSRRIDDLPEKELGSVRTRMGFLFQGGALFDSLTVYENIVFPIRQHHRVKNYKKLDEIVEAKLTMVGMNGFQD